MAEEYSLKNIVIWSLAIAFFLFIYVGTGKIKRKFEVLLERPRSVEAIRTLNLILLNQKLYRMSKDNYAGSEELQKYLKSSFPRECGPDYYFYYDIPLSSAKEFKAIANRCTRGGKEPQAKFPYSISVNNEGKFSSSVPEFVN